MGDLTSPFWIKFKGVLFLFLGIFAAILILVETQSLKTGVLLAICVWAFCRAYYFAFYVIEHYVDPSFKFAGLGAFLAYWFKKPKSE